MFESKKLREERAAIVAKMNELAQVVGAENRSMNADELAKFDAMDNDQKRIQEQIESAERFERLNSYNNKPSVGDLDVRANAPSERDNDLALRALILNGVDSVPAEYQRAANRIGANIGSNVINCHVDLAQRDQTKGTNSAGGFTIPGVTINGFEKTLKAFGGIQPVAYNISTATGNPFAIPTMNDTSNVGALAAELDATTNTSITLGQKSLGAYRITTGCFKVSNELINDSGVNLSQIISDALAERLFRKMNAYLAVGTGSSEPAGLVTGASTSSVTTAANDAVTYAELLAIYHSLDPAYRMNAKWFMNDTSLKVARSLVDTTGRPLFQAGLQAGEPDTLLGKPIVICQEMDSISGSAKKWAIFGDPSKFWIRTVQNVQINVLRELYALENSIGFVANLRMDSILVNSAAAKFSTSKT